MLGRPEGTQAHSARLELPLLRSVFDLLRRDGFDLTSAPYVERREELERLELDGGAWTTYERFDDGRALFSAVCELGFEGVRPFRPGRVKA